MVDTNKINCKDFCYITKITADEDILEDEKTELILNYFNMKMKQDVKKYFNTNNFFNTKLNEKIEIFEIDKKNYSIKDLKKLKFVEFIELYNMFQNYLDNFSKIISIAIFEINTNEKYDSVKIIELSKKVDEIEIGKLWGIFLEVNKYFNKVMNIVNNLNSGVSDPFVNEKAKEIGNKWGVLSLLYQCIGDDITKSDNILEMSLIDILNYLNYRGDMNMLERISLQQIKNK